MKEKDKMLSLRSSDRCGKKNILSRSDRCGKKKVFLLRSSDVIAQRSARKEEHLFACDVALRIGFRHCVLRHASWSYCHAYYASGHSSPIESHDTSPRRDQPIPARWNWAVRLRTYLFEPALLHVLDILVGASRPCVALVIEAE